LAVGVEDHALVLAHTISLSIGFLNAVLGCKLIVSLGQL